MSAEPVRRQIVPRLIHVHDLLAVTALVLWLLVLTPPVLALTSEYEFAQSTQFCLFAVVVPALFVVGRPWRWFDLTSPETPLVDNDGQQIGPWPARPLDRWVRGRLTRHGHQRVITLLIIFVGQSILWRSAPVVDALIRHPWLAVVESFALVIGGAFLWLELVESAPFHPTTVRPYRIGISAVAMWTVWVIAYLMAMAPNTWYSGFRPVVHPLFSHAIDQQVTTALMWFITAAAFLPIIFSNLYRWLQSEEDPDEELYLLVRREHSRGFFGTNPK
ncbi:MAG TPA: cytochrome c oxidase assembly protein [Acidimicrobiales bacterium]